MQMMNTLHISLVYTVVTMPDYTHHFVAMVTVLGGAMQCDEHATYLTNVCCSDSAHFVAMVTVLGGDQ